MTPRPPIAHYRATACARGGRPSSMRVMTSHSSRFSTVARSRPQGADPVSLPAAFGEQLSALYGLVQRSSHVFASPLGPFTAFGRSFQVPRFVYFGPHTSDAGLRLAFLGAFDHRDLRPTLALLHVVEGLALKPDLGQGLNLSFFPLIDVLGLAGLGSRRFLAGEAWARSESPELRLLEREARTRGFHGFIRVESAPGQDVVGVSLRGSVALSDSGPDLEIISSEDIEPFEVRWEASAVSEAHGPLGVADDVAFRPFELTLRIPASWSAQAYSEAAASILKRFVVRYRAFIAYGQHL